MKVVDHGDSIEVSGFLASPEVLEAVRNVDADQTLEDSFEELLSLGARVKHAMETTSTAALIESSIQKVSFELDSLETRHRDFMQDLTTRILSMNQTDEDVSIALRLEQFRQDLEKKFTSTEADSVLSKIKAQVDEYLKNRELAVVKLLSLVRPDPSSDDAESPLLRVYNRVEEVINLLNQDKGKKKARSKATKKGIDFEDDVFAEVRSITDPTPDVADNPGRQNLPGRDGNNEGDITVDFNSLGRDRGVLVLECKKIDKTTSKRVFLAELDKGISNRAADYGIIVTTSSAYSSSDGHPFWEDVDNRRAILVLPEGENGEIDFEPIRFALLVAQARIRAIRRSPSQVSLQLVEQKVKLIKEHFGRLAYLRSSFNQLLQFAGEADVHLKYLELNIPAELRELEDLLNQDEE